MTVFAAGWWENGLNYVTANRMTRAENLVICSCVRYKSLHRVSWEGACKTFTVLSQIGLKCRFVPDFSIMRSTSSGARLNIELQSMAWFFAGFVAISDHATVTKLMIEIF